MRYVIGQWVKRGVKEEEKNIVRKLEIRRNRKGTVHNILFIFYSFLVKIPEGKVKTEEGIIRGKL